jgi:hypothetical protein
VIASRALPEQLLPARQTQWLITGASNIATHESLPTLDLCFGPAAARALSDLMVTFGRQP